MTLRNLGPTLAAMLVILSGHIAVAETDSDDGSPNRRVYVSVGTGIDFSRGDYGERDTNRNQIETDTVAVPFFARIEWEPITFRASIPILYIDGSDQITGGDQQGDGTSSRRQTFGVGDVTASLTYSYYPVRQSPLPIIDLIIKVRAFTSAPNSLGTSGTDISIGTELAKTFGRVSVFGGVQRRFKTGKRFDDIWLTSVGASFRFARWISIGVAYDFREGSVANSPDSNEISPYASLRLSDHTRLTPYGVIGLTDGAPDWGVGSTISYEF